MSFFILCYNAVMSGMQELKPNPNNPRIISKEAFEQLKAKILRNPDGLTANKIVHKDGIIIAGNQRYRALQELQIELQEDWFKDVSGWTDEQIREYLVTSNVSDGTWDWDLLLNEYEPMELTEWGLEVPDWKDETEVVEDEAPEVDSEPPVSKLGEVYQLGRHKVMCGDSTDFRQLSDLMDGKQVDMVFTDPPYSVNYSKKNKEILGAKEYSEITNDNLSVKDTASQIWKPVFDNLAEIAKDDCSIYCTMPQGGDQMMMMMMMMMDRWQVKHELIWVKESPVFSMNRLDYDYKHEPIAYGWMKKHNWYGKGEHTKSVWEIHRDGDKSHPTMKPVALVANAILNSTKIDDLVVDVFLGSGSTLIACEQTDRTCYGMELDPKYVDVIRKRYAKFISPDNQLPENWAELTPTVSAKEQRNA
jgi:DNA modification methylase